MVGLDREQPQGRNTDIFPPAVVNEAQNLRLSPDIFEGRPEVRGITFQGSKYAIATKQNGRGYLVSISIPDVASIIPPGSEIDTEAYRRGLKYREAGVTRNMLPRAASDLMKANETPTVTVTIPLDEELEASEPTVERTKLVRARPITYETADLIMQTPGALGQEYLEGGANLAHRLIQKRKKRGALAFFDRESGTATTEDGYLYEMADEQKYISRALQLEIEFLTNEVLARYITDYRVPLLYRNQQTEATAPEKASLFSDIALAIAHPDVFKQQPLLERLRSLLRRPTISPIAEGHYSQSVPFYAHFVSPESNYADLVNQRILVATFVQGEESPYDVDTLQVIGDHLTEKERKAREEKKKELKIRQPVVDVAEGRDLSKTASLIGLDRKQFSKVVAFAAVEGGPPENVSVEILRRIQTDELIASDLLRLLITRNERTEIWQQIHSAIMRYLSEKPNMATMIVKEGAERGLWQIGKPERTNDERSASFTTIQVLIVAEDIVPSEPKRGTSKKEADQRAMLDVLAKITGHGIPILEEPAMSTEPIVVVDLSGDGEDHKSHLNLLSQANGWARLDFELIDRSGPSHAPVFTMRAVIIVNGNPVISDPVAGISRKAAEQAAAEALIRKISSTEGITIKEPKKKKK